MAGNDFFLLPFCFKGVPYNVTFYRIFMTSKSNNLAMVNERRRIAGGRSIEIPLPNISNFLSKAYE